MLNDMETSPSTISMASQPGATFDDVEGLRHVHGPLELQAALLALLLPAGSRRAARAWQIETAGTANAEALHALATGLPANARLPWFDLLLQRLVLQPLSVRQALFRATRRVMGARGVARPIDRLHWLWMRQVLGESTTLATRPDPHAEAAEWSEPEVAAIAVCTAFLSRMVRGPAGGGAAWYDEVMTPWRPFAAIPPCDLPPGEAMAAALRTLQAMSWMKRPLIVRQWLGAASPHGAGGVLEAGAADALRLVCALLDSPQPPELARHHVRLSPDGRSA